MNSFLAEVAAAVRDHLAAHGTFVDDRIAMRIPGLLVASSAVVQRIAANR